MKVVLKGGSAQKNDKIENFFMEKIFPILEFGIAIELSDSKITVYEKVGKTVKKYIDPTAEVIVELTEEARNFAKDGNVSDDKLKQKSGEFFDEAQAIRKIEELQPDFSVEYYSCRYSPPPQEIDCKVHGSIEHIESVTGKCPSCGKP
ncbi:MAG: hypothetical protein KAS78_01680 [Candidatus Pacebacteria bacterium]|nr:hypothetical protein [Candidatus Paceibacterota bacterium]